MASYIRLTTAQEGSAFLVGAGARGFFATTSFSGFGSAFGCGLGFASIFGRDAGNGFASIGGKLTGGSAIGGAGSRGGDAGASGDVVTGPAGAASAIGMRTTRGGIRTRRTSAGGSVILIRPPANPSEPDAPDKSTAVSSSALTWSSLTSSGPDC